MAATSARLLRLLSLLQARRYWGGSDLAERLEISSRTLRRDVERLRELGYPVEARRGVDGGYQLAAGAALPPLILDDEEAVAIGVGLRAAVQGATVAGIAEASARALAKVAKVMPPRLRRQVDALGATTIGATWGGAAPMVDSAVLTTVAQACHDGECLEFSYTAREGETSRRHVEPHRLVLLGRRWYLVAFDLTRFDWRSFRLDRLDAPAGTGRRGIPREPPGGDAAEFVRRSIANIPAQQVVEALVEAPAAAVRARIGYWASVEELDGDRCRVRVTADSTDWPIAALGATGAEFEVLTPAGFVDQLQDWSERLGRAGARRNGGTTPRKAVD